MHPSWSIIGLFIWLFISLCDCRGVDLGACDDTYFSCPCGTTGFTTRIKVNQCTYFHKRKTKCKPCNKLKEKDVCPKFLNCASCYEDGGNQCFACPNYKFGAWCENTCFCQNGAECDRQGRCICPKEYDGAMCENRKERIAFCHDPGEIPHSQRIIEKTSIDSESFKQNTKIKYICNPGFQLVGEDTIFCLTTGAWSAETPSCVKVDFCEEPSIPEGGFVNFLPPLKTARNARMDIRAQSAVLRTPRLPVGLNVKYPEANVGHTTTAVPRRIPLLEGQYIMGTRAMYDCKSRYYQLIGSRTRRCQIGGAWSGRSPTCMPVCGRSDSPRSPFIVNGNSTDIGQWPWQVGLARLLPDYDQWYLLCGGSLISETWVVTAAHCVTYSGTTLSIDPDKFQVYLGKYYRDDNKDDEYVQVKKLHEIHVHPDYDPTVFDADIALLQLDSPAELNTRVQTVCLPSERTSRENIAEGRKGIVTGWGMNENNTYSKTLQQAVLPVVSHKKCEEGYKEAELPLTVTENMFCAGYAEGKTDACSGDSGGPIVFLDESSRERKWILEGIVSWGSPNGCGHANQYGGFTTVSKFLDWIHMYL